MDGSAGGVPAPWAGRRRRGDDRRADGTGGAALARAYAWIAAFLFLVDGVNIASSLYDARRTGHPLPAWEPVTWEFTSGVGFLCSGWVIYLALVRATPGRASWGRLLLTHGPATAVFSALHITVMMLQRIVVHAAFGGPYAPPSAGDLIYEYRKDLVAYVALGMIFWLVRRPGAPAAAIVPRRADRAETAMFDIVEGPVVRRTPVRQILAVRAAGNYVEFLLDDGRRPLMRAALAGVEEKLSSFGFVRTHRSWIVNPARVTRLQAAGSGDYRLELGPDAEASLSRRFREALQRLKRGEA